MRGGVSVDSGAELIFVMLGFVIVVTNLILFSALNVISQVLTVAAVAVVGIVGIFAAFAIVATNRPAN